MVNRDFGSISPEPGYHKWTEAEIHWHRNGAPKMFRLTQEELPVGRPKRLDDFLDSGVLTVEDAEAALVSARERAQWCLATRRSTEDQETVAMLTDAFVRRE
jgi:hypothetical protein